MFGAIEELPCIFAVLFRLYYAHISFCDTPIIIVIGIVVRRVARNDTTRFLIWVEV